ncbi:site-specific DNA-methyltransferase [Parabacteroides hominis]|uniref:Site-specific DNA-methyltransferase n=1 Tax=Parabacteroides hominis TaxID=2763057 RepID=A0ABR7DTJ7_9BACT|nr:site-specific DNA-methyltransferase [Parabacteroides hominis]MBC5634227.1 site-specific DNA-methyltransferase [Parabacteroides hominis]
MNKKELYNKILQLDGLTNEEKSELLGLLRKQKKYGLVWEDKPENVEERLREELPVLVEDTSKAIISTEADVPNHILIEGDNLEALTALAYTHEGKIDVIYIDPPYNTGNKDFIYNDSFVDKEDSYRHSKWLSFMSKRLRIAKQLLSDKGVIFISIDDNEQAQLKLLCDEIFGNNNFITNIIWQSTAGSNTGNEIVTITEYVLVYTANRSKAHFDGQPPSDDTFKLSDEYVKERGRYTLDKLDRRRVGGHYSEALNFPIEMPDGTLRYPGGGKQQNEGWNYLWSKTKVQWGVDNGFIVFKKSKNEWAVYCKRYQKVDNSNKPVDRTTPYRNLITSDLFNTAQGTAELANIFDIRPFAFPKPSIFVKFLLSSTVITTPNAIILDFFAGSGTTLHATMQLNAEDGGHRKCILVTNNENNICEEVTYERNKRVINGYSTPKGEEMAGLKNNTLRYYRTSFVGRSRSMKNMRQLMNLSTDMLCIKEDLYAEQSKFGEQPTYKNVFRYFDDGNKRMMIIYKEDAVLLLADLIQKTDYEGKMRVYVFSPSEDPWEGSFEEVQDKVELCALPQAIYNAYRRILPKKKEEAIANESTTTDNANQAFDGLLNFDEEEAAE